MNRSILVLSAIVLQGLTACGRREPAKTPDEVTDVTETTMAPQSAPPAIPPGSGTGGMPSSTGTTTGTMPTGPGSDTTQGVQPMIDEVTDAGAPMMNKLK